MKLLLAIAAVAAVIIAVDAQSISVGNGQVIYQILFWKWQNPEGKLFTGKSCNFVAKTCQTKFTGYVDIKSSVADKSDTPTWPGPVKVDNWPSIGKKYYSSNSMNDFAYLNLTGVEPSKFKSAVLRVKVIDSGYVLSNEINSYIANLPGLSEIGATKYESDAKFSQPIELESLSTALPSAVTKGYKPDRTTIQQQHLFVKVRAWGIDLKPFSRSRSGSLSDAEAATNDSSSSDKSGKFCNSKCRRNQRRRNGGGSGGRDSDKD